MSIPSSGNNIKVVETVLLPKLSGALLTIWFDATLPPGVDIMNDPFVWQKSNPTLAPNLELMKLWDAPESNKITVGWWFIENVPDIIGAPSGRSAKLVKLSRPCLTWMVCFLPLFWSFLREACPWDYPAWGHILAKWSGLPHLKQQSLWSGRAAGWVFGLGPFCCCWGANRACWGKPNRVCCCC